MENNWSEYLPAAGYQEFKGLVDKELNQAAEGFVRIGYLLKVARDTNILYESGYKSVVEFAFHEYGLTKDIVSRYIAINDRYSRNGYSDSLDERYKGFGMAKLAEMLTLPDNLVEVIPTDLTRREIQEIKKEYAQEQATTDIEMAIEAAGQVPDKLSVGERILYEYFKSKPEEYLELPSEARDIQEYIRPGDSKILTLRIPGTGKCMLTLTREEEIKIASMRGETFPSWTWTELIAYVRKIAPEGDRKQAWSVLYEESFPEPDKPEEKKEDKKQKKVEEIKPKKPKPKEDKTKEEKQEVAPVQPSEPVKAEVVPGESVDKAIEAAEQEIKKAEIMAAPMHTEEPESLENTEHEPITRDTYDEQMKRLKELCQLKWNSISGCISMNLWLKARQHVRELTELLDQMEALDNMPVIEE